MPVSMVAQSRCCIARNTELAATLSAGDTNLPGSAEVEQVVARDSSSNTEFETFTIVLPLCGFYWSPPSRFDGEVKARLTRATKASGGSKFCSRSTMRPDGSTKNRSGIAATP